MSFQPILTGLDIVGRPNGRLSLLAWAGRVYDEDFANAALFLDFSPSGMQLYFYHGETEDRDGRTIVIAESQRYDRALALSLEAQKLVDVFIFQQLRFDAIQNFMAVVRLLR